MKTLIRTSALALAAGGMALSAVPAEARDHGHRGSAYEQSWDNGRTSRDRYGNDTRYYGSRYHSQPVYRGAQTWRGNDGRNYCRKSDGTTGLIVGAAAGALLGRAVDGGYNHTTGTVIGGVLGALLGKSVAQGSSCR
jgi:glycine zipper 2TM protein